MSNAGNRAMRQFVTRSIHKAILGALAAWAIGLTPVAKAQSVAIDLAQGRALARQAALQSDWTVAEALARALLEVDPTDSTALSVMASVATAQGEDALPYARRAWQSADGELQHYEAARLAAVAAQTAGRLTLAQWWLRRADTVAPGPAAARRNADDYRALAARNPLHLTARINIGRSDNLNGGSETAYNIIDGVPWVGILDGSAQALAGTVAAADLRASYRQTPIRSITARLSHQSVWLGDAAKAQAPGVTGRDFAQGLAELGTAWTWQEPARSTTMSASAGHTWVAGSPYQTAVQLGLTQRSAVSPDVTLRGSAFSDWKRGLETNFDDQTLRFETGLDYAIGGALPGVLRLSASAHITGSTVANRRSTGQSLSASYDLATVFGPFTIGADAGFFSADYSDYTVLVPVPGGRQDRGAQAALRLGLPELRYGGFSPTLTLRHQSIDSNVSRFDRTTTGLELGFVQNF